MGCCWLSFVAAVKLLLFGGALLAQARAQVVDALAGISRLPRTNLLVFHNPRGEISPVRSISDWDRRREEVIRGMKEIMGPLPNEEKKCALDVITNEAVDCGAFIKQSITYASEPGSRVPAFLLVPKQKQKAEARKMPALLALHPTDMQFGKRVVVESLRDHYHAYARDLAERGYVVLEPAYPRMADYQPDLKALGYES